MTRHRSKTKKTGNQRTRISLAPRPNLRITGRRARIEERSSHTHLSPTPNSRSIGAASSSNWWCFFTGSIRRRPYNPFRSFISLAKPQNATPTPQSARGRAGLRGRERSRARERERERRRAARDERCVCVASQPRTGISVWRWLPGSVVFLVNSFLASLLRSWASSFEIFRFLLWFFLGQEGIHEGLFPCARRWLARSVGLGVQWEATRAVYDWPVV
jgi:hypothetical protein